MVADKKDVFQGIENPDASETATRIEEQKRSGFTPEDFDYVCMADGKIYQGPDSGETIENPGKYAYWKGHPISHSICPTHETTMDPRERMNIWGATL